jgi:hypothetical protein
VPSTLSSTTDVPQNLPVEKKGDAKSQEAHGATSPDIRIMIRYLGFAQATQAAHDVENRQKNEQEKSQLSHRGVLLSSYPCVAEDLGDARKRTRAVFDANVALCMVASLRENLSAYGGKFSCASCFPPKTVYHRLLSPETQVNGGHSPDRGFFCQPEERLRTRPWAEAIL